MYLAPGTVNAIPGYMLSAVLSIVVLHSSHSPDRIRAGILEDTLDVQYGRLLSLDITPLPIHLEKYRSCGC